MSDYTDPTTAGLRLSNADRDDAVAALGRAHTDGRITAEEYTERSTAAQGAVTRGDLAPLFSDLPNAAHQSIPASATGPAPDPDLGPPSAYAAPPAGVPRTDRPQHDTFSRPRPLGGAAGVVIVSLTPIVVLIVFLLCGFFAPGGFAWSWVFWLAVPIVGIIVYGPGGRSGYNNRD